MSTSDNSKKFIIAKKLPNRLRPGRRRPVSDNKFMSQNRTRYLIGGNKFGFGHRRFFLHKHIEKSLGGFDAEDNTGDLFIDVLERAPQSTHNKVIVI